MSSDDTRSRIINAAGEVFAEHGFRAATIREICRRADVNVASVNYYFGDKENLYLEVFRAAHPEGPSAAVSEDWPADGSPEVKLRAFIHEFFRRALGGKSPGWMFRLLQREILEPTPILRDVMQEFFREKFALLMSILDEILPPDMPAERRHQIGFSIIGQCVHFHAASPIIRMVIGEEEQSKYHTVELLTKHVSEFVLAGLGLARPLGKTAGDGRSLHIGATDAASTLSAHREHESADQGSQENRG